MTNNAEQKNMSLEQAEVKVQLSETEILKNDVVDTQLSQLDTQESLLNLSKTKTMELIEGTTMKSKLEDIEKKDPTTRKEGLQDFTVESFATNINKPVVELGWIVRVVGFVYFLLFIF